MLSTVIFDFADTIALMLPTNYELVNSVASKKGIEIDEDVFNKSFKYTSEFMPYSSLKITSSEERSDFYYNFNSWLLKSLGLFHMIDLEELLDVFFETGRHWALKSGVEDLFEYLNNEGVSIGIISNFDSKLEPILEKMNIRRKINYLSVSQNKGLEKPDKQFSMDLFNSYDLDKNESLYIGDSYNLDYVPANGLGIKTYLLDEKNIYQDMDFIVRNVCEVSEKI